MDNEKTGKIVKNVLDLVKFSINVDLTSTFFTLQTEVWSITITEF